MTTMTRHATGTFCWPQLSTTDLEGAKKFYAGLFGWKPVVESVEGQPVTLVKKNDKIVGAVMHDPQPGGPMWNTFVAVDDANQVADRVKKAGGKVLMEPFDVSNNGRMAVFQDPTSAVFSVWQAGTKPGADVVNETGAMCWNELITTDAPKAINFYKQVFGWTEKPMKGMNGMTYTVLEKNGTGVGGAFTATPDMKLTHPYWLLYFAVDDCDKIAQKAQQLGGKVMMQPTDIPNVGRFAVLTDPQGAYFAILTPDPNMQK